ncbi:MAG: hypothetical protein ABGU97_04380 [Xylella fastidiosa subsp. multiplex]
MSDDSMMSYLFYSARVGLIVIAASQARHHIFSSMHNHSLTCTMNEGIIFLSLPDPV